MQGFGLSDDLAVQTKNLSSTNNFNFPPDHLCNSILNLWILYKDGMASAAVSRRLLAEHLEKCNCVQAEISRVSEEFRKLVPEHIKARKSNPKQLWLSRLGDHVTISTVLLTPACGRPFETMVSGLDEEIFVTYDTPQEALRGHEKLRRELPKKIRNGEVRVANV